METQRSGHGRRRFLMKAAGLAATPGVAGLAAGCTTTEPTQGSIVE
jgi:hypothetical protein